VDWFKSFISLLALVNPLGAVPMFISLTTQHTGAERERTTRIAAVAVACVIAVSALLGLILASLAVEMIADGLLHFMPALGRP
jgi:small neutral amino acid transporter SnatA (MarC family)